MGMPSVSIMKWDGKDNDRQDALRNYLAQSSSSSGDADDRPHVRSASRIAKQGTEISGGQTSVSRQGDGRGNRGGIRDDRPTRPPDRFTRTLTGVMNMTPMTCLIHRLIITGIIAIVGLTNASATEPPTVPPIKAGLWEVMDLNFGNNDKGHNELDTIQSALKDLPAGMRDQMKALMKSRGVDVDSERGEIKACLTQQMLTEGRLQHAQTGCSVTETLHSSNNWKWHSSCPALKTESDGEVTFKTSETYASKITTSSNVSGHPTTTTISSNARWLGPDCGDIKPMSTPAPTP